MAVERLTFEAAAELAELLEVRDAACPVHGRVRPELMTFPFTVDAEVLRRFPSPCGARACEEEIELDVVPALEVNPDRHLEAWLDELGPRPVIRTRFVAGIVRLGEALVRDEF